MGSRLEKNSESVRKRIESHSFQDEQGEEYEGSKFGGFSDYFRRKKIKLQNLDAEVRSSSVDKPKIFRGIVAHVNGYTQPSLNDLHHLIVSHGGGFMQYLDGKTTVTHIIAANLTPKKAIEFKRYRIVKPAWVVDSVNAGKLLPWDAYRVIDEGFGQKLLGFDDGKVVSQTNTQQRGYRDQTSASWYTSQVKNVAEHIDGEDGAQFPSTQSVAFNGVASYMGDLGDQPKRAAVPKPEEGDPNSSAGFDVTSSLEDALNNVAAAEIHEDPRVEQELPADPTEKQDEHAERLIPSIEPKEIAEETFSSPSMSPSIGADARKRSREPEITTPSKKAKVMTAEEHNAILLADPHIRKSSTANPEFIKQYYSESRLHHLSTWKADLKARFQQMASEKSASQKLVTKRKPGSRRYIMHVDFDSFFCAVSLKSAPDYVDKPAVVAHGNGTGSEIASCNYPAREFGVKNGMWMKRALELCPNIKVLPYDFPAYEEASRGFYEAILDVGGIVQSVSVDEALVDITSLCLPAGGTDGVGVREGSIWREQEQADIIGNTLRARIKEKTGCAVSIGIGGNILLAKVALRKAKPAGQHQIKPEAVLDFIGELGLQDLPGVAYSIGGKLEEIGVKFVKDVRQLTKDRLMTVLGPKTGEKIWDYSRGIDRTEVGEQVVRKSVSAEVNWGIRFISQPEAEEFVKNLCIELQRRLLEQGVKGKQFTMKIMRKAADAPLDPPKHLGHGKCDTFNKSVVLGVATNSAEVIGREAVSILRSYGFSPGELRGLGVQMTKLELLKPTSNSLIDSSQKRINFGTSAPPKLSKQITEDPIDDPPTPTKQMETPMSRSNIGSKTTEDPIDEAVTPQKPKAVASRLLAYDDPIDDINSPKKSKATPVHPAIAIARANAADSSAKKLLNLTGTQFIIPSQIDPEVLSELPQDIRSRLMAQSKSRPTSRAQTPTPKSRSESPAPEFQMQLPSQLDPDVFEALPEDMKAEILASYGANAGPSRAQSLLPQSPRKAPPINTTKKIPTPTKKRGRGRPPGALNRRGINIKFDPHSSLTQSNFVAPKPGQFPNPGEPNPGEDGYSSDTLDPEFLSALPEDVRQEILTEHKRKQLAKKGGLMTTAAPKKSRPPEAPLLGQRKLRLPPRDPRPTFTTRKLSSVPELRDTLSAWHSEFVDDGPHPDDVAAMERYLRRVILDERDMSKVVNVVRWLAWLIDESDQDNEGTRIWSEALEGIKFKVQAAVQERGLGKLEL
ncbi:DNA repair protein [Mollisia scopiformis]|uniref:DNA repair protein REV1 n=1 Tax=Mollisia scopiformis TaxID=149040 RepID=A0A194XQL3_MOLSC|nr:DNA repair protein [Mollisia scopiformis]KUJ22456.1 DNA repair protein [Mollisia scopiformis]